MIYVIIFLNIRGLINDEYILNFSNIHPYDGRVINWNDKWQLEDLAKIESDVKVLLLGLADIERSPELKNVICSSFNAG